MHVAHRKNTVRLFFQRIFPVLCCFLFVLLSGCQRFHNIRTVAPEVIPLYSKTLTVMSYNIRVGYGAKNPGVDPYTLSMRRKNLPPIVTAIRSINPDIVGLQEVHGSGQARKLAQALNMNYAYEGHATSSSRPSWWGVALLSKYPIQHAQGIEISSGHGNTKSALLCTVDVRGQLTTFLSVHKDKDLQDGSSFRVLMRVVKKIPGPVVLIGDLNIRPWDPRLQLLRPRFIDTATAVETERAREARNTGTFLGLGRIDYVLVDPQFFVVEDAGIIDRAYWDASDHLGYYTTIRFRSKQSAQP